MQQQKIALHDINVQRSKLLPQLSLGYVNQSVKGLQNINGVEKFYSTGNRFSSVVIGVNVPLFAKAIKSRVTASKYNYDASQFEYNEIVRQQRTFFSQLLLQYKKNEQQINYYEQHALKQAQMLREHSTLQLNSGAISYIEWMMLVQQSIQLEADYFTALNDWNNTVIELNAYSNN
jgi:cobalt-zinc-cadmium resistance protein CzcA